MHKNLDNLWIGPYKVVDIVDINAYHIETLEGEPFSLQVNG